MTSSTPKRSQPNRSPRAGASPESAVPTGGTAPSSASRPARAGARRQGGRAGFTLTEMLIIIGIILALMAVLLPAIGRAWRQGQRARMSFDLQTISTALVAYKQDHNDYPRTDSPNQGAITLASALIAAGDKSVDGADGPGFRTRRLPGPDGQLYTADDVFTGRVWGPYLDPTKWKLAGGKILDRYGQKPILYYPGNKSANIYQPNGFVAQGVYGSAAGPKPRYNYSDNNLDLPGTSFQVLMGDRNHDGSLNSGEAPAFDGDFVLWSAGPDLKFGQTGDPSKPDQGPNAPVSPKNRCDDVANFPRSEY